MDNQTKEYITHPQLIHIFAQGKQYKKILYSTTGTMYINGRFLYYEDTPIAYIHSYKNKIAVILKNNNINNNYKNRLPAHSIIRSFSKEWNIFISSDLHNTSNGELYKNILLYIMTEQVSNLSNYEILLQDGIRRNIYNYKNSTKYNDDLTKLIFTFGNKPNILNKRFKIKGSYYTSRRWGSSINYKYCNISANELLEDKVFTDEEWDIINFKQWVSKYVLDNNLAIVYPKSERRAIYDDLDKRNKVEKEINTIIDRRKKEKAEELIKHNKEILDKWLKLKINTSYLYDIPIHLRLDKDIVQTTQNAEVPVHHAKLLFKYFMNCVNTNTTFIAKEKSIRVGYFNCTKIDKDSNNDWYLVAGCHTIYKKEIDLFIDMFKPEWRNEL